MRHLMFKKKYWDKIVSGEKRITIRKKTKLKPGDRFYIHSGGLIVGEGIVKNVYTKSLEEIGPQEAKKEGMPLPRLKKELKKIYGKNGPLYIIEFDLLKIYDPPIDPKERRYGEFDPVKIAERALKERKYSDGLERKILEEIVKTKSIRAVAKRMGGLHKRKIIRKILERIVRSL